MIIHDGKYAIRVVPAREPPPFPRDLEQQAEAGRMASEAPTLDVRGFLRWWNEQAGMRGIARTAYAPENVAILTRLLRQHGEARLKGAALMVLNNMAKPLTKGYQHHMRYLAAKLPEALDLLARWEVKDG